MTKRGWRVCGVLLAGIAALWFFSSAILRGAGSLLVNEGPPVTADMIIVLAGDETGHRIIKAAELARQGYAPAILVDNSHRVYATTESQLATEFAVKQGYSPGFFITVTWNAWSTSEELAQAVTDLRKRGVHKAIVVTTVWHTARSVRVCRRLAPEIQFYPVGAEDPRWHNGAWWTDREGRKNFFLEGLKTIADFLRV